MAFLKSKPLPCSKNDLVQLLELIHKKSILEIIAEGNDGIRVSVEYWVDASGRKITSKIFKPFMKTAAFVKIESDEWSITFFLPKSLHPHILLSDIMLDGDVDVFMRDIIFVKLLS